MACPAKELLSRWADGTLEPREAAQVARHANTCDACAASADELRAAVEWLSGVPEPGPSCLSAEAMAAALDAGRAPAHVRLCPRCAAEWRAFQPERRATRRLRPVPETSGAWVAAAAVFLLVALLFLFANRRPTAPVESSEPLVFAPVEPEPAPLPAPPRPAPIVPEPKLVKTPDAPKPAPAPEPRTPEPAPVVVAPAPEPSKPVEPAPARPTLVEAPRALAALQIRTGALSAFADGKWTKVQRFEEGLTLRADGRTQLDFAQARLTLDASSRFSVTKDELSLQEGTLAGEVAPGSKFTLVLDEQRVEPQAFNQRVMFVAKPDRVVIEEGSALWKDVVLPEGVEHLVRKDRLEAQRRRSLPMAPRSREALTWRMDLSTALARKVASHIETLPEGKMLVSVPFENSPYFHGQAAFSNGGEEQPLFTVKPNTAIRFRYYLTQPGPLELVMKNATKDENFNRKLDPVLRQWTTVTLYARDVAANPGGKKVSCDVGDKYTSIGWFVGKPGAPTEIHIEKLEILEVDR